MDSNATDPFLFAMQRHDSADVIELCRIFILNLYMKHYGHVRTFRVLEAEFERRMWDARRAAKMLITFFAFTWFLRSSIYNTLVQLVLLPLRVIRILRRRYLVYTRRLQVAR